MPTLAGFLAFIRSTMQISATVLPDTDPVIGEAYAAALELVNLTLAQASSLMYTNAVYNLGGSYVINYGQDQSGAEPIPGTDPPLPFFAYARKKWQCLDFVSGVVQSTSDNGSGSSLVVQDAAAGFTLANLKQLKDPYGRQYLMIAQSYGPAAWGIN